MLYWKCSKLTKRDFVVNFERIQYSSLLFLVATLCKYMFVIRVYLGYSQLTKRHMVNVKIWHFVLMSLLFCSYWKKSYKGIKVLLNQVFPIFTSPFSLVKSILADKLQCNQWQIHVKCISLFLRSIFSVVWFFWARPGKNWKPHETFSM